jgi:Putative Actinobacterial Holin-X, holin superfamily III
MASPDDIGTMPPPRVDRSIGGLFGDLAREASRLFRQELALAKAELMDKLGHVGTGAAELAAGALIAYAGLLFLLGAAAFALARVVPAWAAALIVGGVTLLVGIVLLLKGRRDVEPRQLLPDRTLHSLREDAAWMRERMR